MVGAAPALVIALLVVLALLLSGRSDVCTERGTIDGESYPRFTLGFDEDVDAYGLNSSNDLTRCYMEEGAVGSESTACDGMATDRGRDLCLLGHVKATGDGTQCPRVADKSVRELCLVRIAEISGDASRCELIDTAETRDACYNGVAILLNDYELCSRITDTGRQDRCFTGIARAFLDVLRCDRCTTDAARNECIAAIARDSFDLLACQGTSGNDAIVACLLGVCANEGDPALADQCQFDAGNQLGSMVTDPATCEAIPHTYGRFYCILSYAQEHSDADACEMLGKVPEDRFDCLRSVAVDTRDHTLCDQFPANESVACHENIIWNEAVESQNVTACERISEEVGRGACIHEIARLQANVTLCARIPDVESRRYCQTAMELDIPALDQYETWEVPFQDLFTFNVTPSWREHTSSYGGLASITYGYMDPLIPAIYTTWSGRGLPTASVRLVPEGEITDVRVTVGMPGLADDQVTSVAVVSGATLFNVTLAATNDTFTHEQRTVTIRFAVSYTWQGQVREWVQTETVTVGSRNDFVFSEEVNGTMQDYSGLIAALVTPRDPVLQEVVTRAKEYLPDRSFDGYQTGSEEKVLLQVAALYQALNETGISYVSSTVSFSGEQNIRLPADSVRSKSANCVDGTILFASLLELVDIDPVVVNDKHLAHAYVGFELMEHGERYVFLETTMVGTGSFSAALAVGDENLRNRPPSTFPTVVDIEEARFYGIAPLHTG